MWWNSQPLIRRWSQSHLHKRAFLYFCFDILLRSWTYSRHCHRYCRTMIPENPRRSASNLSWHNTSRWCIRRYYCWTVRPNGFWMSNIQEYIATLVVHEFPARSSFYDDGCVWSSSYWLIILAGYLLQKCMKHRDNHRFWNSNHVRIHVGDSTLLLKKSLMFWAWETHRKYHTTCLWTANSSKESGGGWTSVRRWHVGLIKDSTYGRHLNLLGICGKGSTNRKQLARPEVTRTHVQERRSLILVSVQVHSLIRALLEKISNMITEERCKAL